MSKSVEVSEKVDKLLETAKTLADHEKVWAAEDKKREDYHKAKTKYDSLQKDLANVEKKHNLYLSDENTDHENTRDAGHHDEHTAEYWHSMHNSATSGAGERAEEHGHNINKLMGRVIY